MDAALAVSGLTYAYGTKTVLNDVSFSIAQGETVILLGPNGAGKTTLFSLISGLFATRKGTIEIAGMSLQKRGAYALAPLGIVFQQATLDLDLTVRQNLSYFAALRGMNRRETAKRIAEEAEALEFADRLDEKVRTLNGGHRRRMEIARALLNRPEILLLDEPTVGLDIPTRRALISAIHAKSGKGGTALLWATHLIDEVWNEDRVIILDKGRIVTQGRPAQLLQRTQSPDLEAAFATLLAKQGEPG